ncbi:MAG: hypothetical protein P1U86_20995 [Verrucomicrobiales bacterium]|nr:hypothetical protein [Verrucomicrobiales bacterium]
MSETDQYHRLIADYQTGQISDEDFAKLEAALRDSEDVRNLFHRACRVDSRLRRIAENLTVDQEAETQREESKVVSIASGDGFRKQPFFKPVAAAAAVVLLSALTWTIAAQKRVVANLVSSEDAVWERGAPTESGLSLTRGSLRLSSGIATIRFVSGVEMTLEAPVRLYLKGPVRATLVSGTVVVKSDREDDFVLETEFGQAVAHEGEFAAFGGTGESGTDFEAISGKVIISHDFSREVTQLTGGATATMSADRLDSSEERRIEPPFERFDKRARIRTDGRAATFIRNNRVRKWTRPEFLTLKTSTHGNGFDQRSVIGFDLTAVESAEIEAVSLRLNVVHSGRGLISRLPKMNRFAVYGVVNPAKEDWLVGDLWEEAPAPDDGVFLARFEIPRSQTSGEIDLTSEAISDFVRKKAGHSVSFVIVRETANRDGDGPGYTHAIASDSHPEVSGPMLEMVLKQ